MYQFNDLSAGPGSNAAALRLDQTVGRPARSFGQRIPEVRDSIGDLNLVVDLGVRIGSGEWFRGLATCAALCYAAWSFAPTIEPIPGAVPAAPSDVQREEISALSIAPLAYGADSGRRMAPTDAVEPLAEIPERPILNLRATLGRGDAFARVLERAGVGANEAAHVAQLVGAAVPLADIRPGTQMEIVLGRRPNRQVARPLDALSFRARFDLRVEVARVDGELRVKPVPIAVDDTPLRIQGLVGASLYRSARAAGVPARIVESYIRALSSQISVPSGLSSADRFDIIIEHRRAETGETETGKLLYAGLDRASGKDLQLMQWDVGGRTQWFEASGVGRQSGTLQKPVPGAVTSNYGLRMHPILGYSRMHRGMDFRAAHGTPILAATDGRVSAAGWAGGYGRQVRINHAGGLMTSYSHMSRITVRPGQSVRQGQVIGHVGSTGLSTGPHLHYELHRNGRPVDPRSVRFVTRSQLSGSDLADFRARLRGLLATPIGGAPQDQAQKSSETQTAP